MGLTSGKKSGKERVSLLDFTFEFRGYGHYRVIYESPKTYKRWSIVTDDMPLVDATKNSEGPTQKDLNRLKALCKKGGIYGK